MMLLLAAVGLSAAGWFLFYMLERKRQRSRHPAGEKKSIPPVFRRLIHGQPQARDWHYDTCRLSVAQRWMLIAAAAVGLYLFGLIFYASPYASLLFVPIAFLFPRMIEKQLLKRRKRELALQFKYALHTISTSLAAGRSVENSFVEALRDLQWLYVDPDTDILREIEWINHRVENGDTLENALTDFSRRANVEDITSFTQVFVTCKRTGGNLVDVMRRTAHVIGEKMEIEQEIAVLVAQKRFESKIMLAAPLVIVALLRFTSPDYMAPLYDFRSGGPIVMTFALAVLAGCCWLTGRIMDIRV